MRRVTPILACAALLWCAVGVAGEPEDAPRILLLAGPPDEDHPPGTHEYERFVRLIDRLLADSPNAPAVRTEVHPGGWPSNPESLERADAIVLVSSGSDRRKADHPFLVGDRMDQVGQQMQRGCGLAVFHWSTFVPRGEPGDRFLEWVGGHFDYESDPGHPRGWASRIQTLHTRLHPARHPVARGLGPFELHEELYYRMRLSETARPVVLADIPGEAEPQVVAWAVERADGGRGLAFTGGHFHRNWEVAAYRRLILNAVLWTAGAEVPQEGVESSLESVPQVLRRVEGPDG